MSTALWCDRGNHAFKGGEPGSQSLNGQEVDPLGNPINVRIDICAEHAMGKMAELTGGTDEEPSTQW